MNCRIRVSGRWVFLTFEDAEMAQSAQQYEQPKEGSQGLHFLLIQPDDAGMTETGIWLLKKEDIEVIDYERKSQYYLTA